MDIKIDTSKVFSEFDNHLALPNNKRILFTGKFGSGKSTFLSEYFESRKNKFITFKLYPVEYSTSNSEDIFELIKFDLIYQLMVCHQNALALQNDDYSPILKFQFDFVKELKFGPSFFKTLSLIDPTGKIKALSEYWDYIAEQYDQFKAAHHSEEDSIWQFIFKQGEKIGSPREKDYFSILVTELIQRVKKTSTPPSIQPDEPVEAIETVLIVDDIDRLDPDQIFRLFNIFSLNFGKDPIQNKFGFDRVVFVSDIANIREIYKHKYGKRVDFEGYIDKFYSVSPYKFDTNKFLSVFTNEFIRSFDISPSIIDFSHSGKLNNNDYFHLLHSILGVLISHRQINLRTLINTKVSDIPNKEFLLTTKSTFWSWEYPIIFVFNFLEIIYDQTSEVKFVLLSLKEKFADSGHLLHNYRYNEMISGGDLPEFINFCMPFILPKDIAEDVYDQIIEDGSKTVFLPQYDVDVKFSYAGSFGPRRSKRFSNVIMHKKGDEASRVYINPFQILFETYEKCISIGAI